MWKLNPSVSGLSILMALEGAGRRRTPHAAAGRSARQRICTVVNPVISIAGGQVHAVDI
jgi:hypothetical protein